MKFIQHYSSSRGNLYEVVADNGKRLLLECGVRWPLIEKALNYDLSNIEGCLISHYHADHSKAIVSIKNVGINVYINQETWDILEIRQEHRTRKIIADKTLVRLDSFEILAFDLEHDCPNLGFIIREKATNDYLLYAVDTSFIKQRFAYPFTIIAIECAYDITVLQPRVDAKEVNETYAKRLLTSHTEKQNCIRYLKDFCNREKLQEIHLLHLSGSNIDKEASRAEIENMFFVPTFICRHKRS